jgi:hypothetical protein
MKTEYGGLIMDSIFIFAPTTMPKSCMTLVEVLKHREKHGTSIMHFDVERMSLMFAEENIEDLTNVDK